MARGFQAVPFESTKILRLQPGDIVVLRVASDLSEREHQDTMDRAKVLFPDHEVLVLAHDADVQVLRKD